MFNVELFKKLLKNKYTNLIQLDHSDRITNIVDKDNGFYHIRKLYDMMDLPIFAIPTSSNTEDPRYLIEFEKLLKNEEKDFKWFHCWYNNGGIAFDVIIICSNKKEEQLYNHLLRFENLKVFV